jgi:hypothetical protein
MAKKAVKKQSTKKSAAKAPARAKSAKSPKGEAAPLDPITEALRRRRAALLSR